MPDAPKTPGLFLAVGHDGLRMTSTDGSTWSNVATGKEGEVYRAACFGRRAVRGGGVLWREQHLRRLARRGGLGDADARRQVFEVPPGDRVWPGGVPGRGGRPGVGGQLVAAAGPVGATG